MAELENVLLRASEVLQCSVVDQHGERVGHLEDLVVRLADRGYPRITGLLVRMGARRLFVPAKMVSELKAGHVQITGPMSDLTPFERRAGEVLLREDILGRKLIDVRSARLIHANDLALENVNNAMRLVGVDSNRGGINRWFSSKSGHPLTKESIVDWADVEPFVGRVPTARLFIPLRRLKRLHPAQIADLVEHASHDEGNEIIHAVGGDQDLEADVFEELDTTHQVEFLEDRSDAEAASVLAKMVPDDAADLIGELDQDRRAPILRLLPREQHEKISRLLAYHPSTAGGMMSPDYVSLSQAETVAAAMEQVKRKTDLSTLAASTVFLLNAEGLLDGALPIVVLVRARAEQRLEELLEETPVPTVLINDDIQDLALKMSDYNLVVAPVIDSTGLMLGIITADDLIDELVPEVWRRRRNAESGD